MSKRRHAGEIVWKVENSGFSGGAGLGIIRLGSTPDKCMLGCGDSDCQEWPDVWECDVAGETTGICWCHVSECEMKDE